MRTIQTDLMCPVLMELMFWWGEMDRKTEKIKSRRCQRAVSAVKKKNKERDGKGWGMPFNLQLSK